MRRRERVAKYSLSVTDEEWERIKARASRAGKTVSAYLVECALAVDPRRPAITLALTHEEQDVLLDLVGDIHTSLSESGWNDPSILDKICNGTSFLARQKMMDLIREGRSEDLLATLTVMFGEDEAARIVKALADGPRTRQGQG